MVYMCILDYTNSLRAVPPLTYNPRTLQIQSVYPRLAANAHTQ